MYRGFRCTSVYRCVSAFTTCGQSGMCVSIMATPIPSNILSNSVFDSLMCVELWSWPFRAVWRDMSTPTHMLWTELTFAERRMKINVSQCPVSEQDVRGSWPNVTRRFYHVNVCQVREHWYCSRNQWFTESVIHWIGSFANLFSSGWQLGDQMLSWTRSHFQYSGVMNNAFRHSLPSWTSAILISGACHVSCVLLFCLAASPDCPICHPPACPRHDRLADVWHVSIVSVHSSTLLSA